MTEHSARKVALLCCGLFFAGAFLWFIPPMAMRIIYPDLHSVWPSLANPGEAAYAVASLTLLPHGLIGVMLAAMFSATMANLSAQFNLKSAILSKDVYQALFRKGAGEKELLVVGWITTFAVGGATTILAAVMAGSGQSVFHMMLTFNTLISLAYGPPRIARSGRAPDAAVVGTGIVRCGLVLGDIGRIRLSLVADSAGRPHHSGFIWDLLPEHVVRSGDTPARTRLFKNLNTPVNIAAEFKDSPDFTAPVFPVSQPDDIVHGAVSLLLLLPIAPPEQRTTDLMLCRAHARLWEARYILFAAGSRRSDETAAAAPVTLPAQHD